MPPTFADLGVPAHLLAVLDAQGITEPRPIQAASLADALAGRDVCGRAPTGSGKTLAFAIPAVLGGRPPASASRRAERRGVGSGRPEALILVPTRELAAQVERVVAPLAKAAGLRSLAVYGGTPYNLQRGALRRGVQILVGCPGRVEDLVERGDLHLGDVRVAVVDEADRMADMGFLPAVRRILDRTRPDRQTLLWSATLDGAVDVLVSRYQDKPRRHEVDDATDGSGGDVTHVFWQADGDRRLALTAELIRSHSPAVVFCRTRLGAERLTARLGTLGVHAAPIHGDRSQVQRDRALEAFAARRVAALVATDVAARGIHVDNVSCVVHYDLPADTKDYTHRSGRTGRAGEDGLVVSLVPHAQAKAARALQRAAGLPEGLHTPDPAKLPVSHGPAMALDAGPFVASGGGRATGVRRSGGSGRSGGTPRSAKASGRAASGWAGGAGRAGGSARTGGTGRAGDAGPRRETPPWQKAAGGGGPRNGRGPAPTGRASGAGRSRRSG